MEGRLVAAIASRITSMLDPRRIAMVATVENAQRQEWSDEDNSDMAKKAALLRRDKTHGTTFYASSRTIESQR